MKMKSIFALLSIVILCLTGCETKQTDPFEGNWELVSVEGTVLVDGNPVSINMEKDKDNFGMKLIHDNYFMFSGQDFVGGASTPHYGYGTYTYENNVYTETVNYHFMKEVIGTTPAYEMTVTGDTLIQKGPLSNDPDMQIIETYVRK